MPYISDGEIRSALKRVDRTKKQETLVDGEGHGTGRLVLAVRPMPTRVTADWMAQQWRDKKRIKKKLGAYPSMSLACAREIFDRDCAGPIQKGRSIKIATDTQAGTVADLFQGYVEYLKASGKPSWKEAEKGSTRSPTPSAPTALLARSSQMRSSRSSDQSTSAVPAPWRTMYGVTSARPSPGA